MDAATALEGLLMDKPDAVPHAIAFVRVALEFWNDHEDQPIQDVKDCIPILNAIVRSHEDAQV